MAPEVDFIVLKLVTAATTGRIVRIRKLVTTKFKVSVKPQHRLQSEQKIACSEPFVLELFHVSCDIVLFQSESSVNLVRLTEKFNHLSHLKVFPVQTTKLY